MRFFPFHCSHAIALRASWVVGWQRRRLIGRKRPNNILNLFEPDTDLADSRAALTAASSVIGPIIPPSIPVIIYALIVSGVSVPALFLAGVVPGILLAVFLSAYVMLTVKVDHGDQSADLDGPSSTEALLQGILPLLMPVLVVGSILAGVVTPTEAASFAVGYALILGLFVYRKIKLSAEKVYQIFRDISDEDAEGITTVQLAIELDF